MKLLTNKQQKLYENTKICCICKESLNIFKKALLNFIQPSGSTVFNCNNPIRLSLSHLRKPKVKYSFQDLGNPICGCGNDIETLITNTLTLNGMPR